MSSRRQFLSTSACALFAGSALRANPKYPYPEFEQRIARKDFRGMTKDVLPTPCMVVDLDLFEKNLRTMASYAKTAPIQLRPHVKVTRVSTSPNAKWRSAPSASLRRQSPSRN